MVNNNRKFLGIPALLSWNQRSQEWENSILRIRKSREGKFKITCIISNFPTEWEIQNLSIVLFSIVSEKNLFTFHPNVHVRYVQKLQKRKDDERMGFFSSSNRTTGYRMSTKPIVIQLFPKVKTDFISVEKIYVLYSLDQYKVNNIVYYFHLYL